MLPPSVRYWILIVLLVLASCSSENEPPVPALEIFPRMGDSLTVFYFDARNTSDRRNYSLSLRIRWDWDGNQVYAKYIRCIRDEE